MSKSERVSLSEHNGHTLEMEKTTKNLFLLLDGVKIAKRGQPGTRRAGKWIPLLPGLEVNDIEGGEQIEVIRDGQTLIPIGPGSAEIH